MAGAGAGAGTGTEAKIMDKGGAGAENKKNKQITPINYKYIFYG